MGDLLSTIQNIANLVKWGDGAGPFWILFTIICWFTGALLLISAIKKAGKRSEMGQSAGPWSGPVWTFVIATMFLAMPMFISVMSFSLFGVTPESPEMIFEHSPGVLGAIETDGGRAIITAIVTIVQFVGLIGVMRGLYMLNHSAQGGQGGPSTFGPGMTFVIAGIVALNFPIVVGMMSSLVTGVN